MGVGGPEVEMNCELEKRHRPKHLRLLVPHGSTEFYTRIYPLHNLHRYTQKSL